MFRVGFSLVEKIRANLNKWMIDYKLITECTSAICMQKMHIGTFVILRYDKILFTECAKPTARKSSKSFKKKSAKSILAKKSVKLPDFSRPAVGLGNQTL